MDGLERTLMTISCRDCDALPKVSGAGKIIEVDGDSIQLMHNGLKILAGGYHGDWMSHVIRGLRGHHEPQEELLFDSLLKFCRHNSLVVELGAFWAYYSLWYLNEIPGSRAICIEPDPANRLVGEKNVQLNGLESRVQYLSGFVGGESQDAITARVESQTTPVILPMFNMNEVLNLAVNHTIELLHLDIQGSELPFLISLRDAVDDNKVRFVVVSTHHSSISGSPSTHEDCIAAIKDLGGRVLCEHNVHESFSGDGLIVASFFPQDEWVQLPNVSRNRSRFSLFPDK